MPRMMPCDTLTEGGQGSGTSPGANWKLAAPLAAQNAKWLDSGSATAEAAVVRIASLLEMMVPAAGVGSAPLTHPVSANARTTAPRVSVDEPVTRADGAALRRCSEYMSLRLRCEY